MTTCTTPSCERDALVSRNPDVLFSMCETHTGRLMAQAFGAIDSPLRAGTGVPPLRPALSEQPRGCP